MILPHQKIKEYEPITPILKRGTLNGVSYGLGAASYDVRIDQTIHLWPGRFVLASTMEVFQMPDFLAAVVHDKSTWARLGVCVQNTFIDPNFHGYLTLEITNHSWKWYKIERETPIAQIVFHQLSEATILPYDGKYQQQKRGPQKPIR